MSLGSIFASILPGLTKAENFLVTVFNRTSDVDDVFTKLEPATKAAVLATFYDTVKTAQSAIALEGAVASKNIPAVITLSEATLARVKAVVADGLTEGSTFKNDLVQLGLAIEGKTLSA